MRIDRCIRCILFDLGGTLWARQGEMTSLAQEQAYAKVGSILRRTIGNEMFPAMDDGALGALLHQTINAQLDGEFHRHPAFTPNYALVTANALQQLGVASVDSEQAEAIFEALRVRIPGSRVLFADTLSTLAALKQRGYILGVVTNRHYGGPLFQEDVAAMGLLDYFEYRHMAISADLAVCKPHPNIFNYALQGLRVLPEEAAMVGDSLEADIAGANGLNILSIWKPVAPVSVEGGHESGEIKPDITIGQLSELLEIFGNRL
jgi:HAD superfamily hydrolase (TIGR01509 family)